MKFPVLSMLITKTMPELSDLMHLEWYKKPPTGPYSGSWWLPRSPFCLCLPACSSPQPGPLSSLQAPALHLWPHGASRGWVMPPLSDSHPRFPPAHDLCSSVSVPSLCTFVLVRLAPLRSTTGRGYHQWHGPYCSSYKNDPSSELYSVPAHFLQRFVLNSPEGDPHPFKWFTVPTQSQLENFHNMSCFWHWCCCC